MGNPCESLMDRGGKIMAPITTGIFRFFEFTFVYSTRGILSMAAIPNYFSKPQRCPKITDKVLLKTVRELAEMIRKREITSESVVRSYISRIEAVNPIVNAVVENRFTLAIQEAKNVDTLLATTNLTINELEQKYPLLGVPFTVKESIAVEGFSNAAGLVFSEPRKAKSDAPVVKLCKEAGGIPIALTNTPELCINFETYNKVTGVTKNPYDTRRTSAGSSGGEAALLGSAASVFGLGSDLYGSIRLPSNFCGIWGHKPTPRAVPHEGHFPHCESYKLWPDFFTMGLMTRFASDLPMLMQVIRKHPQNNLNGKRVNTKNIKFYYMENSRPSPWAHGIDQEITEAMQRLITQFSKKFSCEKISIEGFDKSGDYSVLILISLLHYMDSPLKESSSIKEFLKFLTNNSKRNLMTVLYMLALQTSPEIPEKFSIRCLKKLNVMKQRLCEILGEDGVLLFPTHPTPATFHNQCFGKFDDFSYTGIFNVFGLPVTQCPLGLTSNGLPIGIQVVGKADSDDLTIAVAELIEKEFGGWKPPPYL